MGLYGTCARVIAFKETVEGGWCCFEKRSSDLNLLRDHIQVLVDVLLNFRDGLPVRVWLAGGLWLLILADYLLDILFDSQILLLRLLQLVDRFLDFLLKFVELLQVGDHGLVLLDAGDVVVVQDVETRVPPENLLLLRVDVSPVAKPPVLLQRVKQLLLLDRKTLFARNVLQLLLQIFLE